MVCLGGCLRDKLTDGSAGARLNTLVTGTRGGGRLDTLFTATRGPVTRRLSTQPRLVPACRPYPLPSQILYGRLRLPPRM